MILKKSLKYPQNQTFTIRTCQLFPHLHITDEETGSERITNLPGATELLYHGADIQIQAYLTTL